MGEGAKTPERDRDSGIVEEAARDRRRQKAIGGDSQIRRDREIEGDKETKLVYNRSLKYLCYVSSGPFSCAASSRLRGKPLKLSTWCLLLYLSPLSAVSFCCCLLCLPLGAAVHGDFVPLLASIYIYIYIYSAGVSVCISAVCGWHSVLECLPRLLFCLFFLLQLPVSFAAG